MVTASTTPTTDAPLRRRDLWFRELAQDQQPNYRETAASDQPISRRSSTRPSPGLRFATDGSTTRPYRAAQCVRPDQRGGCSSTFVGSGANAAIARPFLYQGHAAMTLGGIWSTIGRQHRSTRRAEHGQSGTAIAAQRLPCPEDGQVLAMARVQARRTPRACAFPALSCSHARMNRASSRVRVGTRQTSTCPPRASRPYHVGNAGPEGQASIT